MVRPRRWSELRFGMKVTRFTRGLALLLCLASGLTSPVTDQPELSGGTSTTTRTTTMVHSSETNLTDMKTTLTPPTHWSSSYITGESADFAGEGGPIRISSSSTDVYTSSERIGVPSSIVARKGVQQDNSTEQLVEKKQEKQTGMVVEKPVTKENGSIRHKPKPTVTIGEGGNDPVGQLSTLEPPATRRRIDYIIPIAITAITLPLMAVASFAVYKRGKDCWDKRHYRRMDFLIDGMYND
ncbi:hypothetical protein KM043_013940 [Ampulex compressa]|nr:hypothetical protein KM043_013940 [Ampulex compressa]